MINLRTPFICIALMSLLIGNLYALTETNFQRFLAASSLPQVIYVVLAVFSYNPVIIMAAIIYLFVYLLTNVLLYYVLSGFNRKFTRLTDLTGLFYKNKKLGLLFISVFLSLAGLPPFMAFFSKIFLLQFLVNTSAELIVFIILIFSVISLIYYLKICTITLIPSGTKWFKTYISQHEPLVPELENKKFSVMGFLKFWGGIMTLQLILFLGFINYFDVLKFLLLNTSIT